MKNDSQTVLLLSVSQMLKPQESKQTKRYILTGKVINTTSSINNTVNHTLNQIDAREKWANNLTIDYFKNLILIKFLRFEVF